MEELKRYHYEMEWKSDFNFKVERKMTKKIRFSNHTMSRCYQRKINRAQVIENYNYCTRTRAYDLFEVKTNSKDEIIEFGLRFEYSNYEDVIIIFRDMGDVLLVKTLWLNDNTDSHKTIDKNLYL